MPHPKAALIERVQAEGRGKPRFETRRSGPEHEPTFHSSVSVAGTTLGHGDGATKRDAERRAAEAALAALDGAASSQREAAAAATPRSSGAVVVDEPFEGPWPVFERVLAASLEVAHARVDPKLKGDDAVDAVQGLALRLYKGVLEDLGEVVEDEDEP